MYLVGLIFFLVCLIFVVSVVICWLFFVVLFNLDLILLSLVFMFGLVNCVCNVVVLMLVDGVVIFSRLNSRVNVLFMGLGFDGWLLMFV